MGSILLTGGAGFIGSHTAVELIAEGYDVIIADNFSNSDPSVIDRIGIISGKTPRYYNIDVSDKEKLEKVFSENSINAVIHFAGYKAVGESVAKPLMYYRNNLDTTLTLLEVMKEYDCRTIVFSSSATVYGAENPAPYDENMKTGSCTNPYGTTKAMIEQILQDTAKATEGFNAVLLRYFNPIGAHASGLIGEKPNGIPNNLMPYITQVAVGQRDHLNVFGNDYDTHDGTGVRDYIHVVDLAIGHVKAIRWAEANRPEGKGRAEIFNLGTGIGYSVLDVVNAFEKANGVRIPYVIALRRAGDLATCYANAEKAEKILGWKAERGIEDMCRDSWRWQQYISGKQS